MLLFLYFISPLRRFFFLNLEITFLFFLGGENLINYNMNVLTDTTSVGVHAIC